VHNLRTTETIFQRNLTTCIIRVEGIHNLRTSQHFRSGHLWWKIIILIFIYRLDLNKVNQKSILATSQLFISESIFECSFIDG